MQPNGVTSEVALNDGNVNDHLTDSNSVSNVPQALQQANHHHHQHHHHHQQHQHQARSDSPTGGHIPLQQQPPQTIQGVAHNQHQFTFAGQGDHQHHHHMPQQHQSGTYYHRLAQPQYHNQQHMQHYHLNKYNSHGRGASVGVDGSGGVDNESNVNHVLLITVINPHYTITCDLIHQIFSGYGKVNRIVIFKKNGVQAMVEFDNVESAKRAKAMLYGCDIYSGCCTLRIEYAKPTRLNIHKNDSESFDYTTSNPNTNVVSGQSTETSAGGGEEPHSVTTNNTPRGGGSGRNGNANNIVGMQHFNTPVNHQHHHHHHHPHSHSHANSVQGQASSGGQHGNNANYGNPLDQQSNAFHQEEAFNPNSRGNATGSNNVPYPVNDSYMPHVHHGHHQHSNIYSRHDQPHHQGHNRINLLNNPILGRHNHNSSFSSANTSGPLMIGPNNLGMQPQGTVMMVYGLQLEKVNCDRLFNLFCLYGNVVRVKFLRTKEGCAMVQMGDVFAVDRCVSSLNKITLFNSELQISYSKQAFLHDVIQPFILPDGSPSFKDFMGNKNNRFKNPELASKNRILPPSPVLHFFNAPYGINEDELMHLFKTTTGHEPVAIKMFTPKSRNTKSFTGLVTFKDAADATEALVMCNHLTIPKPGAPHPYILRLCFSPPT